MLLPSSRSSQQYTCTNMLIPYVEVHNSTNVPLCYYLVVEVHNSTHKPIWYYLVVKVCNSTHEPICYYLVVEVHNSITV